MLEQPDKNWGKFYAFGLNEAADNLDLVAGGRASLDEFASHYGILSERQPDGERTVSPGEVRDPREDRSPSEVRDTERQK